MELIEIIIRVVFQIVLYKIGYYSIKILTLWKYPKKQTYDFFDIFFYPLVGILSLVGLFFLFALI